MIERTLRLATVSIVWALLTKLLSNRMSAPVEGTTVGFQFVLVDHRLLPPEFVQRVAAKDETRRLLTLMKSVAPPVPAVNPKERRSGRVYPDRSICRTV